MNHLSVVGVYTTPDFRCKMGRGESPSGATLRKFSKQIDNIVQNIDCSTDMGGDSNTYRERCFTVYPKRCLFCDSEDDIEVHHVDGDRDNDDISNLVPVCKSCHYDIHSQSTENLSSWTSRVYQTELPDIDDSQYETQAESLAEVTDVTPREAEAYLRRQYAPSDVTQRALSARMGIAEATYSQALSRASSKLDSLNATLSGIVSLIVCSPIGEGPDITKEVVNGEVFESGVLAVTEDVSLKAAESTERFGAVLLYRDFRLESEFEDVPDGISRPRSWSIHSIEGLTISQVSNRVLEIVNDSEACTNDDLLSLVRFFENF